MIAASPAAAIAIAAEFRVSRVPVLRGMPYAPPKADLFRQTGQALRMAGRSHWMLTRQVPASAILVNAKSMVGREMPSEHLAASAAFQADDIIAVT
jgi:hypothetical protein